MSWRLRRLEGRGVRVLAPFALDLPERGLVHVVGDSGAGKSTLLSVAPYALGYGPPATRLQTWLTGENGKPTSLGVVAVLTDGAREVRVERSGKLCVTIDGVVTEGKAAAQDEALAGVLGEALVLHEVLGWRRQRKGSAFLGMPDDQKKAFLAGPLGLETHEKRIREGLARVASARQALERAEGEARASAASLGALGKIPDDDVSLEEGLLKARSAHAEATLALTAAETAWSEANGRWHGEQRDRALVLEEALRVAQARRASVDALPAPQTPAELAAWDKARYRLSEAKAFLGDLQRGEADRRRAWERDQAAARAMAEGGRLQEAALGPLRALIAEREADLVEMESGQCPTCQRPWPEGVGDDLTKRRAHVAALRHDEQVLVEGARDASALELWEQANPWAPTPDLATMKEAVGLLEAQLGTAAGALLVAQERAGAAGRAALVEAMAQESAARRDLEALRREGIPPALETLREELGTARTTRDLVAAEVTAVARALKDAQDRRRRWLEVKSLADAAEVARQVKQTLLNEEEDTLDAVRAFVGRIFDELLLEVADEVNALLATIPNVQHCTLSFRSEVLNQRGEVSRTAIVPVLSVGGHEIAGSDMEGASGGMLSAIELVVDLGVLHVRERQMGVRLGWLTVDEAFEGLPAACRDACFAILRQEARDRLVLVVDHASEIGGLADSRICVEFHGKQSVISCV